MALVCDVYCELVTFPFGILGQVRYLIVSIPDPCCLSYFSRELSAGRRLTLNIKVITRFLQQGKKLNMSSAANLWILGLGGVQWLSGRVLDSRPKGSRVGASPASLPCVLEHPSLALVQLRKTHPNVTERLLTGNQIKQTKLRFGVCVVHTLLRYRLCVYILKFN